MTDDMIKNGYDNSYSSLADRFDGRGLSGSCLSEAAEQERREIKTRLENPSAYALGDIMRQDFGNRYRSGSDGTEAYMTVDDFFRLNSDEAERRRRGTRYGSVISELTREQNEKRISTAARPAHPYLIYEVRGIKEEVGVDEEDFSEIKGRRETVYDAGRLAPADRSADGAITVGGGETEMYVRPSGSESPVRRIRRSMFRKDLVVEGGGKPGKSTGLAAALAIVTVFMFVLALPVTLSVMKHIEATKLSRLESEIRNREAEIVQLGIELEAKNNLFLIEKLAREKYGMVELDKSVYSMIRINPSDAVEHSGEDSGEDIMPALFSALGIRGR